MHGNNRHCQQGRTLTYYYKWLRIEKIQTTLNKIILATFSDFLMWKWQHLLLNWKPPANFIVIIFWDLTKVQPKWRERTAARIIAWTFVNCSGYAGVYVFSPWSTSLMGNGYKYVAYAVHVAGTWPVEHSTQRGLPPVDPPKWIPW